MSIPALLTRWRERAASNGAIYAQGITECADELLAAIAALPPIGLAHPLICQDASCALRGQHLGTDHLSTEFPPRITLVDAAELAASRPAPQTAEPPPAESLMNAILEQAQTWRATGDNYSAIQFEHAAKALEVIARRFGARVDIFGNVTPPAAALHAGTAPALTPLQDIEIVATTALEHSQHDGDTVERRKLRLIVAMIRDPSTTYGEVLPARPVLDAPRRLRCSCDDPDPVGACPRHSGPAWAPDAPERESK